MTFALKQQIRRLMANRSLKCQYCADASQQKRSTKWQRVKNIPVIRYLKSLKWTPIPLSLGFALIAYQQYRHVRKRESGKFSSEPVLASHWEVSCYKMLPLKSMSRVWGWVNDIELPVWARKPVLSLYVKSFGCDLSEAEEEDLRVYRNLGEFFRRAIKSDVRPVDPNECVVSPADGRVLHFGKVERNHVEQVKGVTYSLEAFLGPKTWKTLSKQEESPDYERSLRHHTDSQLYHCVVYLAPGDYHRFHSPVNWRVQFRRHFSGELLSVNPGVARWIAGLFNLNERVVYVGKWKYGFFSMTAVGATNVGSIKVGFDKELTTNGKGRRKGTFHDQSFENSGCKISIKKGDDFGEFNLGSTIVLVFEAPPNFNFNLQQGQQIKFGQGINHCIAD